MRGKVSLPVTLDAIPGSPPRVRGKERLALVFGHARGITPACAGKRQRDGLASAVGEDHPRVCGEKVRATRAELNRQGSPPRVRGKVALATLGTISGGITPACAGKSRYCINHTAHKRDHPRVCGEKSKSFDAGSQLLGSPPRVRGKAGSGCIPVLADGITPACAGKSYKYTGRGSGGRDHPRVCGEKLAKNQVVRTKLGITPACAGKSTSSIIYGLILRDHPRVCGEKNE